MNKTEFLYRKKYGTRKRTASLVAFDLFKIERCGNNYQEIIHNDVVSLKS